MANSVSNISAIDAKLPTTINWNLDRALSVAKNGIAPSEGAYLPAGYAPTAERRKELNFRLGRLEAWLGPAGSQSVKKEVGALLASMSHRSGTAADIKVLLEIYAEDLRDLPYFAVVEACKKFRRGEAGDGHWCPNQAEIRAVARDLVEPWAREEQDIRKVLAAKVMAHVKTPETKARVRAEADATMAELKRHSDPARKTPPAPREARDLPDGMVHLSEALGRSMGLAAAQTSEAAE